MAAQIVGPISRLFVQLIPGQEGQLRIWAETLRSLEFGHTDQAAADAMTIGLAFARTGAAEAGDADRQRGWAGLHERRRALDPV